MSDGPKFEELEQLVDDLSKEAVDRKKGIKNKPTRGKIKSTPLPSQSDGMKRVKELEIEAVERKQEKAEERLRKAKREAPKRDKTEKMIEDVIGKFLTD